MAAVAVIALFVPFNMGGCGSPDLGAVTSAATSVVTGKPAGSGGRSNLTGVREVDFITGGFELVQGFTMGDREERALGQSVAVNVTNRYGVVRNEPLNKYVTMVAQTLLNASDRGGQVYVAVLNTDEINAFAGPNGYVMITRGALRQMQDESELAGVLAHEVGHIIEGHGLQAAADARKGGALAKIGTAAAGSENQQWAEIIAVSADTVVNSLYSQAQERAADTDALRLTARAGYDPNGFARYLARVERIQAGGAKLFPSHPGISERVRNASSQIARENLGGRGATNAPRFKQNVLDTLQ
jgi:predicted Zn-dependent protease